MPSSNSTVSNRLAGRSALITGATRGIGLATAERFAEHGANIVLSASNLKALKETAARLNQYAVDVSFFAADLSASSEIEDLFSFAVDRHSQLDVLVNNAGMHIAKPFIDHSLEEFEHLMRVNVRSVFQLSQYAIRHMQALGRGKVINVASIAGLQGSMNSAAYNTSKHAVVGLTRCMALENAKLGINVNAICPGIVETDLVRGVEDQMGASGMPRQEFRERIVAQIPCGRVLQPQEIANLAVYLASDESNGMNGQAVAI